mgnify:CR=1 FL=1
MAILKYSHCHYQRHDGQPNHHHTPLTLGYHPRPLMAQVTAISDSRHSIIWIFVPIITINIPIIDNHNVLPLVTACTVEYFKAGWSEDNI